jgi:Right handed beta helix region
VITAAEIQMIRNANPGAILPGIDTVAGNPSATSSLISISQITTNNKAPYFYDPVRNTVNVTQAGAVLSGINFGTASVVIGANNVTIKDCTFTGTTNPYCTIRQPVTVSGAIVENCTFQGSKAPTETNAWISSNANITIKNNKFLDSPQDAVSIGGAATGGGVITGNYFSAAAYMPGAHADAIWVTDSTQPVAITDNFIDGTQNADAPGQPNNDIRLTAEVGSLSNVTVSGNYLLGGGFTVGVGGGTPGSAYQTSNVSVTNNYIGFGAYGPYSVGTNTYVSPGANTIVDFTNPTYSTQALAAYELAGVPTAKMVSATSAGSFAATGSAATTVLGNGFGAHLGAGTGETNFVGGEGAQYLYGGQGANILTYLSIGDGNDRMSAFDPAKDVIDLSHIDADITKAGVQNFTFIGSAPFNAKGGEVRYQLNPANDTTLVQADLVGDSSADFTITLQGLVPLTAVNFALTPSQSSADMANGAALTYSKVKTAAGAPAEYAYSNVQGRPYTSYESFYGSAYEDLAADDLNLNSSANELVLYDPSLMVMRGGGSETLKVGTGSDPLSYHAVETIDATTSGGETFAFSAGFGKETISGFSASGAKPDSVQLAKSAFSYLTAGMTQAQDLAAVLTHGATNASGLTINDTHGDSLTLAGVTSAMVAANPAMIEFT